LKQAVRAGLGLAVMFRCSVERELEDKGLIELHVDGVSEVRPFYLVSNPRKRFSPLQLRLLSFLRTWPDVEQLDEDGRHRASDIRRTSTQA
jgi:DNA-binding transcriptional LysR family regulator